MHWNFFHIFIIKILFSYLFGQISFSFPSVHGMCTEVCPNSRKYTSILTDQWTDILAHSGISTHQALPGTQEIWWQEKRSPEPLTRSFLCGLTGNVSDRTNLPADEIPVRFCIRMKISRNMDYQLRKQCPCFSWNNNLDDQPPAISYKTTHLAPEKSVTELLYTVWWTQTWACDITIGDSLWKFPQTNQQNSSRFWSVSNSSITLTDSIPQN